jgi:hypothetical protein
MRSGTPSMPRVKVPTLTDDMQETEEWIEAMHMSDEDFYAEARPTFTSTDNMQAYLGEYGRKGVIARLLGRRYTGRHARALY